MDVRRIASLLHILGWCLIAFVFIGCGPVSQRSPNVFVVIVHDQSGQNTPLVLNRQPPNASDSLSLSAGGEVSDVIGTQPTEFTIYGGQWPTGKQWTSSDFSQWEIFHVLYPSGNSYGEVKR